MDAGAEIHTERLILRRWRDSDRVPFAALNADPAVMEFLPRALSAEESDALIDRIERHFSVHGFGFWAVEVRGGPSCIGLAGLAVVGFDAPFVPAVEVGWRLAHGQWGKGYATEAAQAALDYAFDRLALDEVVAFTVPANTRSQAVMRRLGMTHDPLDDFDHPGLPEDHPLRAHVLYRKRRPDKTTKVQPQ